MAKRFTDTDKWKKPFIRGLKSEYKILWLYILDECDHAGVWQVDFDVAKIKIGEPNITEQDALLCFGDRVICLEGKWFINDLFCKYVTLIEIYYNLLFVTLNAVLRFF